MRSLRVCLCTVLLSVSVQGYNISYKGWTISGADAVFGVEGASAVLPCTFTHPPTDRTLTGSVLWYKVAPGSVSLVFNCTFPDPGRSRCGEVTQEAGGGRFRFLGNLREGDASIMMERLSREDGDLYRCGLELSVGSLQSAIPTRLIVEAPAGNVSVVTGTEGGSATLPCVFPPPAPGHVPLAVTWMRKDPYRHIVTFRPQADGSWAAENGATLLELVGNPERGNATTRIEPLMVEDSRGYLCLVDVRKSDHYRDPAKRIPFPPYTDQYQRVLWLWVTPVAQNYLVVIFWIPFGLKTLVLLVMCAILYRDKLSKREDGSIAGS
ncbi:sialoadhesin-like [Rhinoraja longicauda]